MSNFDTNLDKNSANFVPLSPLSFITRVKDIYPNYDSLVYGNRSYTWLETYNRCTKFASALAKKGITKGSTVSIIAANTPELFEAHYSIPMTGGVINTINTRLDAETIAYILDHSDAKLLITDTQFSPTMKKALKIYGKNIPIIDIHDDQAVFKDGEGEQIGEMTYEEFLQTGEWPTQPARRSSPGRSAHRAPSWPSRRARGAPLHRLAAQEPGRPEGGHP